MGVQVGFMGVRAGSAGRPAWSWPLSDSGPAAALDGRQRFCTSESIRPVRLLEINIGAIAYRAMWGYGVGPPTDLNPHDGPRPLGNFRRPPRVRPACHCARLRLPDPGQRQVRGRSLGGQPGTAGRRAAARTRIAGLPGRRTRKLTPPASPALKTRGTSRNGTPIRWSPGSAGSSPHRASRANRWMERICRCRRGRRVPSRLLRLTPARSGGWIQQVKPPRDPGCFN
jgi:hypothetical protein